jgi:hypothetical protein
MPRQARQSPAARTTGKPLRPEVRQKMVRHLSARLGSVEAYYPEFEAAARSLLTDKERDARFPFVVRRLWLHLFSYVDEAPALDRLRAEYDAFEAAFEWPTPGPDKNQIERTLATWQKRYPTPLSTESAEKIIQNVRRLVTELHKP